jgi:hypothetical protein
MLDGMRDACAIRWTTHSACFRFLNGGSGSKDGKSTPCILPSNIDAPRSSCTPRNVVAVKSTLAAKEEKQAKLDSQSGAAKRLFIIIMARPKRDE